MDIGLEILNWEGYLVRKSSCTLLIKSITISWNQGLLILILMITKQGLELMIIFQVWLGKTISKVAITKTNQAKKKSWRRRPPQREVFFKT